MKRLFSAALLAAAAFAAQAAPVSVTALTGAEVANAQGERLAVLRDLAVDVGSGFISYAIVDFRDPSALDEHLQAIPLGALRPGLARNQLVLEEGWRDATAGAGASPAAHEPRLLRASSLIGMSVDHPTGADYGVIENLVVELDTGRVLHAVVRLLAGPAEQTLEVPFSALRFPEGASAALLTLAR